MCLLFNTRLVFQLGGAVCINKLFLSTPCLLCVCYITPNKKLINDNNIKEIPIKKEKSLQTDMKCTDVIKVKMEIYRRKTKVM